MSKSSGIGLVFGHDERADVATRRILAGQFEILIDNLDGARDNQDPECLHDLRVATRRTRSALGQIKGVFDEAVTADFKSRFAWLQQVTGPTRDLDVYLHGFEDDEASLPPEMREALEPLRRYLMNRYEAERGRLVAAFDSDAFQRLMLDWRAFLADESPDAIEAPNADREIGALAGKRVWRLAKRVRREARGIRDDSLPEQLHELRKSCKKLRYLIEFFAPLFPESETRRLIKSLKRVLDGLGVYQDLSVQVEFLTDTARRMRDEGAAGTETLLAMGALVGHLFMRRQEMRAACQAVLVDYLDAGHQALFRSLSGAGR